MKKLYIDIRFAKCILALTAGWLMAGCSAEDELENGSATQQLSMTPMVNDLQTTRVKVLSHEYGSRSLTLAIRNLSTLAWFVTYC